METTIKKLKNCKNIVEIKIGPDRLKDEFDKVYENIRKIANIPGFRVGKAPRDLLEQHYGKIAREDVLNNIVAESCAKFLDGCPLDLATIPTVSDIKMDLEKGLSFIAIMETKPVFSLKDYKGLGLKKKIIEVKDEDVKRALELLRQENAQKLPNKDGNEKEIVLPNLDDEFAKDLGFEGLEKLMERIKDDLQEKAKLEMDVDLENQIINNLVGSIDFELPESLVVSEKKKLTREFKGKLEYIKSFQTLGLSERQEKLTPYKEVKLTDKDTKEIEELAQQTAVFRVKRYFILDKIANLENIEGTEAEINEFIVRLSTYHKETKEEMQDYLKKNDLVIWVKLHIKENKVMQFLLSNAEIT